MWAFRHLDPHENAQFGIRQFEIAILRSDAYRKHVKIPLIMAAGQEAFIKRTNIRFISGQKVGTFEIHGFDKK